MGNAKIQRFSDLTSVKLRIPPVAARVLIAYSHSPKTCVKLIGHSKIAYRFDSECEGVCSFLHVGAVTN